MTVGVATWQTLYPPDVGVAVRDSTLTSKNLGGIVYESANYAANCGWALRGRPLFGSLRRLELILSTGTRATDSTKLPADQGFPSRDGFNNAQLASIGPPGAATVLTSLNVQHAASVVVERYAWGILTDVLLRTVANLTSI